MATSSTEHRKYLEELYNVRAWFGKSRYTQAPIRGFSVEALHLQGWRRHRVTHDDSPSGTHMILRQQDNVLEVIMAISVWECANVEAAHEYLLSSLTQVQSTSLERDRVSEIGDILFRLSDTFFIFARANVVAMVRNIGPHVLGIEELANTIDLAVLRRLALGPQGAAASAPATPANANPVPPQDPPPAPQPSTARGARE